MMRILRAPEKQATSGRCNERARDKINSGLKRRFCVVFRGALALSELLVEYVQLWEMT